MDQLATLFIPTLGTKAISLYANIATRIAQDSYAKRLQVGCVVVKNDNIISIGYNGTVPGWDNTCEISPEMSSQEVLHAEENAILKLARDGGNAAGASLICTHSCCLPCAKMIFRSGIQNFYYLETYRSEDGLNFLKRAGVNVWDIPSLAPASRVQIVAA